MAHVMSLEVTHILLTFVSNFQLLRTSRTRDNFSSRALTRAEVFSLLNFPARDFLFTISTLQSCEWTRSEQ